MSRRALPGLLLAAAPLLAAFSWTGGEDRDVEDLLTVARSLAFLDHPPTGVALLGIVYPGASGAGRAEAERLAVMLNGRLTSRGLTLRPVPVAIEQLDQWQFAVLLLTEDAVPHAAEIAFRLAGRGVLTVSRSQAAVLAGQVVMSVTSEPRVEILVSRDAARRAGIRFVSAFRMLIQER